MTVYLALKTTTVPVLCKKKCDPWFLTIFVSYCISGVKIDIKSKVVSKRGSLASLLPIGSFHDNHVNHWSSSYASVLSAWIIVDLLLFRYALTYQSSDTSLWRHRAQSEKPFCPFSFLFFPCSQYQMCWRGEHTAGERSTSSFGNSVTAGLCTFHYYITCPVLQRWMTLSFADIIKPLLFSTYGIFGHLVESATYSILFLWLWSAIRLSKGRVWIC